MSLDRSTDLKQSRKGFQNLGHDLGRLKICYLVTEQVLEKMVKLNKLDSGNLLSLDSFVNLIQ